MMAQKKKKEKPRAKLRTTPTDPEKEFLYRTNLQQSEVIDTFMHSTCALYEEKLAAAEHYHDHLKGMLNMVQAQRELMYDFFKAKGYGDHDLFEFINDLKVDRRSNKKALARLNYIERVFKSEMSRKYLPEDDQDDNEDEQ